MERQTKFCTKQKHEHFLDIISHSSISFQIPRSSCLKTSSPPTVANVNLGVPEVY